MTGCGEGVEGLWAGEGEVRGSPGESDGAEGVSGAGRGAEAGDEALVAGVGLAAAGLVAPVVGLAAAAGTAPFPGLGAVGGPRGFGETGGGMRFVSGWKYAGKNVRRQTTQNQLIPEFCYFLNFGL